MAHIAPHEGNIPLDQINRDTVIATRTSAFRPSGRRLEGRSKLADVIRARGFTSTEVQRITGINWRTMTHYTNGEWRPHVRHTIALCDALECDPEDILEPIDRNRRHGPRSNPGSSSSPPTSPPE